MDLKTLRKDYRWKALADKGTIYTHTDTENQIMMELYLSSSPTSITSPRCRDLDSALGWLYNRVYNQLWEEVSWMRWMRDTI